MKKVIIDSDVAELYGVETRDINKSVKTILINFQKDMFLNLINRKLKICGGKFPQNGRQNLEFCQKLFYRKGFIYVGYDFEKSKSNTNDHRYY